jgi:PPP family 3-phenylpropionic acid transporter
MRKPWPFALYFLYFAATASVSPFIVLYYQGLGFTGAQIGVLVGIGPLVTLFGAPLWTGLADATGKHRLTMSLATLAGMVTLSVIPLLKAFVPVLAVIVLFRLSTAPILSFADNATMVMLADEKEMYGRIRLGGTIGYGMAALVAGVLVQSYGLRFAFWVCAILFLAMFVVGQKLVHGHVGADHPAGEGIRDLLRDPHWLLLLTVAFASGSALATFNSYLFPYLRGLGANESTMGLFLMVGTLSEIPILFFANRLIKRLRPYGLLMLSMVVTGLRMVLLAASETLGLVLFIQLLNGLTFPAMWVASVSYADEHAPPGMGATAQGLLGAAFAGFGMAVGGFIGGPLLESIGGHGLYLVFGAAVLVVTAVAALIERRLRAEGRRCCSSET